MARFLILAFSILIFSQVSQAAIRHIYNKPDSAANACQAHEFNYTGAPCDSPYSSTGFFFRFYYPVNPNRGHYYFNALDCPPGTAFTGTEGFWWDNSRGPFPQPPPPKCSADIADLTVDLNVSEQQAIVVFPGEQIHTTISFGNISESTDYEDSAIGGVFLSGDSILDEKDEALGATISHTELGAGQTVTHNLSVTIPDSTLSGNYFVIGSVNPSNYFLVSNGENPLTEEADFSNNVSEPFSIKVEQPKVEIEICIGNPISTNSGRKLETEVDYQGTGPFPLQFARFYSSRPGNIRGWNFSYSRHLIVLDNGSTTDLVLVFDGGQRYEFLDIDLKGFSDPDIPGLITRSANGFDYLDETGTIHQFDHDGKLTSLINLTGFTQTLHYAGEQLVQVSDQFGKTLRIAYNTDGQIESLTTPDNLIYRYEYNSSGLLNEVSLPDPTPADQTDNPRREYLYESANLAHGLTGIIDENGNRYSTFDYDSAGRAILSTHDNGADQNTINYAENETTVTNPLGKESTYVFEEILGSKRLIRIDGQPTVNCPATSTTKSYDDRGSVREEVDAKGNITLYTYTHTGIPVGDYLYHVGLPTTRIEAAGTSVARTTTIAWHPDFRLPILLNETSRQITFSYDGNARLKQRTEMALDTGSTRVWRYQYNTTGLLTEIDGPRTNAADITTLGYNTEGELTHITNALGHTTAILTHDSNGLPTTVQDPNGVITHLGYDSRLRLSSQRVDSGAGETVTRISYDNKGNVTSITLPDGQTLAYQYDLADRLIRISNDLGEVIEFTIDSNGNRTTEITRDTSNAIVRVQNKAFDELSRLITIIGAANQHTRFGYDKSDNLEFVEDALGRQTHLDFDALDRLINITDALQGSSTFTYDTHDNLTSVTDAEDVVTYYTYDGLDNLLSEVSTARGTTTYRYDPAGNRTHAADANGVAVDYTYDELNRLTSIHYDGFPDETITYTYDQGDTGVGQLTVITDDSGSTTFTYDNRGNLLTDHRIISGVSYTTRYAYNLANQLIQLIYPSGRIVHYELDGISRVTAITTQTNGASPIETIASEINYLPFGSASSWQHSNGLTTSIGYDLDFRVTEINVQDEQHLNEIMSLSYSYNDVSNITQILDNLDINSQRFDYDELNRLSSASGNFGDITYTYDSVGNRKTRTIANSKNLAVESYSYEPGSHRLNSVSTFDSTNNQSRVFTHDANGNTTSDISGNRDLGMVISPRNRLSQIMKDGKVVGEYTYNALGQRVAKTSSYRGRLHGHFDRGNKNSVALNNGKSSGKGESQGKNQDKTNADTDNLYETIDNKKITEQLHFHYDQLGNLIAESDEQGNPIREYIYLGSFRIAMAATSIEQNVPQPNKKAPLALYYIHNDHLGTARMVTDTNQNIVWSMEQTPFGETALTTEAIQMPMRFPGQYVDLESDLSYNYFRHYDPSLGRYLNSDPIGLKGGSNTYSYARVSPVQLSDPKGLYVGTLAGALIGGISAFSGAIAQGQSNQEALLAGVVGIAGGAVLGTVLQGFIGAELVAGLSNLSTQILTQLIQTGNTTDTITIDLSSLGGSMLGSALTFGITAQITNKAVLSSFGAQISTGQFGFAIQTSISAVIADACENDK